MLTTHCWCPRLGSSHSCVVWVINLLCSLPKVPKLLFPRFRLSSSAATSVSRGMEVLVQSRGCTERTADYPWRVGPSTSVAIYTIAKVISPAAVQLRLLHSLCCVHPVFHVSHVKPVLRSPCPFFIVSQLFLLSP